jgi:uncharacterized damage-inducible protein DinB
MRMADAFIAELTHEAETTRRQLACVPEAHLTWKPHEKSMSLGQLALHIAQTPGQVADLISELVVARPAFDRPQPSSTAEVMSALDESIANARRRLDGWDDGALLAEWKMTAGGQTLMALPRAAMVRAIMLNHWYHHRGQMQVYLRLLDQKVPSVYGPTADENPFQPQA